MSRIRSIKPEWLDDELLSQSSSDARTLSIALICLADDYGNGRAGRAWLAGRVFPGRPIDDIDAPLGRLVEIRYCSLYEAGEQRYFALRNWNKHQRVDRPGKPLVPRPNLASIENDTEKILATNSQESPGISPGVTGSFSTSRGPDPISPLVLTQQDPDPEPTERPGSARARGNGGRRMVRDLKPFAMHDGWTPPDAEIDAQAQKFGAGADRVRALLPEFRVYWARRGDRKTEQNWIRTFANQVARCARSGDLYVEPRAQSRVNGPGPRPVQPSHGAIGTKNAEIIR